MKENPWKCLGTREIYQNAWIRLREDQVIRPDGEPGIYGVVETRLAVGVLALTEVDDVYLIGQYRYPTERYSWEIIEGGSEGSELALETARRELREEAGLIAADWFNLGHDLQLSNCYSSEMGRLFVARNFEHCSPQADGTEKLEICKVSFNQALEMVESGEIEDMLSIIALLRYDRVRRDGWSCPKVA